MSLPVLPQSAQLGPADLIRLYYQSEQAWCGHMAEGQATLEMGSALHNAAMPAVWDANTLFDAQLPESWLPERLLREITDHYAAHGARCASIVLNPSMPPERSAVLARGLEAAGYRRFAVDVLHAAPPAVHEPGAVEGVKIIPARAAYRHLRALIDEWTAPLETPGFAEATMLHYDDPRYDALLAMREGAAVGHIGVMAMGEIGRIDDVYITPAMRGRGLGRLLMARAVEICYRSLFRHVLLAVAPDNAPAQALYSRFGFAKVGDFIAYRAPWTSAAASGASE